VALFILQAHPSPLQGRLCGEGILKLFAPRVLMTLFSKCAAAIAAFLLLVDAIAGAQQPTHPGTPVSGEGRIKFDIRLQPLSQALNLLARQADVNVFFNDDVVPKNISRELRGTYTVAQALEKLLEHTGLQFEYVGQKTLTVMKSGGEAPDRGRGARNDSGRHSNHGKSVPNRDRSVSGQDMDADLPKVLVTGSRLKDSKAADSSAQRVHDQDELERSGAATLAEFAQVIPENFNSVGPISSLFGNTVGASQLGNNPFLGSGFNLSGLGPEATLTLLDGDRLVSGGASGTFVDLSLFPMSAVAEIVTLTGDTSAVYGSDAIAGVVNILSRSGTDGNEARVRYGTTKDGGGGQWVFSQRLGGSWQGGDGMIAYERTQESPVLSAARRYIPAVSPTIDIVPRQSSSSLLGKIEHKFAQGTSVKVHFLYGARDVDADSSGFGGYLLKRDSPLREYGGTVHIDHQLTPEWAVGLYGSYSTLVQSLTTSAPGVSPLGQPGSSSLGEFALSANGEPLTWFGRSVRVAFGAGGRKEALTVPTSPYHTSYTALARKVGDMYVETLLPLTRKSHTLLERLELSLVAREDYYEAVGAILNPKVGLVWTPVSGLNVRGTFARSFRPPTLDELAAIPAYYTVYIPDRASPTGVTDTLVNQSQGISGLKPETARTITGGLDYRRDHLDGWAGSATWFRTVFDNRAAAPLSGSAGPTSDIFTQPELAPYISRSIDPAHVQAIFANPPIVQDYAGAGAGGVMATFDNELTNVARSIEEGVEASLRYSIGERSRRFGAFVIANYLLRDMYQPTRAVPATSLMNNIGQPPDLRARGGVTWSGIQWRTTLNVNYTNGYRNRLVSPAQEVNSWTTLDFQIRLQLPVPAVPVQHAQLAFNVLNLRNTAPPRVAVPADLSLRPVGFDAANASPLGRMLSLELSVAW
jgi:outer membrane receptor protein involved in Fe transport